MKKRIVAIISLLALLIGSFSVVVQAQQADVDKLLSNEQLMNEIYAHLSAKTDPETIELATKGTTLSEFQQDKVTRALAFQGMDERSELQFTDVEIDFTINDVLSLSKNEIELEVYEWTTITYFAGDEVVVEDVMGYGVYHDLTLSIEDDEYTVINDIYDERFITGVCSTNYDAVARKEESDVNLFNELFSRESTAEVEGNNTRDVIYVYYVNKAINYANQYCGIGVKDYTNDNNVGSQGNHTAYYNLSGYGYYQGADCANYVSQCLYAGGLTQDNIWRSIKNSDGSFSQTSAWCNAAALANYLDVTLNLNSYSVTLGNYSKVYPGNPVYWVNPSGSSSSGHQMICTGYNSEGTPVINGHNDDMFRVPVQTILTRYNIPESGLRTVHLVNGDSHTHEYTHSNVYNNSSTNHYTVCDHCRYKNYSNHTFVYRSNTTSHWKVCVTCNYQGTSSAHINSYSSNDTKHWTVCSTCGYKGTEISHIWATSGTLTYCKICGWSNATIMSEDLEAVAN